MADLDKVIAQCEWAIGQPSPTIIEAKKFYEETLEVLKSQQAEIAKLRSRNEELYNLWLSLTKN